jgi:hypothetical protein
LNVSPVEATNVRSPKNRTSSRHDHDPARFLAHGLLVAQAEPSGDRRVRRHARRLLRICQFNHFTPLLAGLHPILGISAVGCALAGRLRLGITALALLALSLWARHIDMFSPTGDAFLITEAILKVYVQPVLAVTAIAAAWFNRHLAAATAAATVAVMLPTIVDWTGVVALIISISIHGF